mgnify:CR=1 FL=1
MRWANFLHIYQPPTQKPYWIHKITAESYRKLFESDPATADGDRILYFSEEQNYNGPATLRAKVALAKEQASGIMICEESQ